MCPITLTINSQKLGRSNEQTRSTHRPSPEGLERAPAPQPIRLHTLWRGLRIIYPDQTRDQVRICHKLAEAATASSAMLSRVTAATLVRWPPVKTNFWECKLFNTSGPSQYSYVILLELSRLAIHLLKAMEHRFIFELFHRSACDTKGSAWFTPLFWFWNDRLC